MSDSEFPEAPAERAASIMRKAADPNRRLPGEDPESADLADARHWARVYAELLKFKERVLEDVDTAEHQLPEGALAETELDKQVMLIQADRLRRRQGFWEARRRKLGG